MKPTFLYIKQHTVTDKLYFGKTSRDPMKYRGSGSHWINHIKIHGYHVETIWYCLFTEKEELVKFAMLCSEIWNIVESNKWANEIPENGVDGFNGTHTDEAKLKMSKSRIGKPRSMKTREKIRASLKGKPFTPERCSNISIGRTGKTIKPFSVEHREKIRASLLRRKLEREDSQAKR